MTQTKPTYQTRTFPLSRKLVVDAFRMGQRKHTISGFIEVDVTHAREIIQQRKQATGESLSFTAFLLVCVGKAIDEHKIVHGYRNWRNQIIVFDEVDATTIIETSVQGQSFPLAHVVRAINTRNVEDIHQEIRRVQSQPRSSGALKKSRVLKVFLHLPPFMRDLAYRYIGKNPFLWKQNAGTIALTAIGMFGERGRLGLSKTCAYFWHYRRRY